MFDSFPFRQTFPSFAFIFYFKQNLDLLPWKRIPEHRCHMIWANLNHQIPRYPIWSVLVPKILTLLQMTKWSCHLNSNWIFITKSSLCGSRSLRSGVPQSISLDLRSTWLFAFSVLSLFERLISLISEWRKLFIWGYFQIHTSGFFSIEREGSGRMSDTFD